MFQVHHTDLQRLRGAGGERFIQFMNALLRAEAWTGGLPQSEIRSQLRNNIPDGGVDTEIRAAVPHDASGWMALPTCWQFKADDPPSETELRSELNKPFCRELIARGYAYRLALLAGVPPPKVGKLETALLLAARDIHPEAAVPRILPADAIAAWASRFPSVVAAYLRPLLGGRVLALERWQSIAREPLRVFVPFDPWSGVEKLVREHADFSHPVDNVCLAVRGEAGVGKTRLVCEALTGVLSDAGILVYTEDDQSALDMAYDLAGNVDSRAVLVADECSTELQGRIEAVLADARARVRVIGIDNVARRLTSGAAELWLEAMTPDFVAEVLRANFPRVPEERRQAYADLAGGFIRLAADMAQRDHLVTGDLTPVLGSVEQYVQRRVGGHERVLEALALVPRVGCTGELRTQLDDLCTVTGLVPATVHEVADKLKDSPGFITRAGRYLYVTPEIVAGVAFRSAWKRWIEHDPRGFLEQLPTSLVAGFMERLRAFGTEEMRRASAAFFRSWVAGLTPLDLADPATVRRLVEATEASPTEFLPSVRHLVTEATHDDLAALDGGGFAGLRSPRRSLVWLAERLAAFPEYFDDAEAILFRLALSETESAANSARGVWVQLFRMFPSGTALPFEQRLALLRRRLSESTEEQLPLFASALRSNLTPDGGRLLGPVTLGGRLTPNEWRPADRQAAQACLLAVFALLRDLASDARPAWRNVAYEAALGQLPFLVHHGWLREARAILATGELTEGQRFRLIDILERLTEGRTGVGRPRPDEEAELRHWLGDLQPRTLRARLRQEVGRSPWDVRKRGISAGIRELAGEMLRDRAFLVAELGWLRSKEARSSVVLAEALGEQDADASLLETFAHEPSDGGDGALLRGYLFGLVKHHPSHAGAVNTVLDTLERVEPAMVADVIRPLGDEVRAVERALRLVDRGQAPADALLSLLYGVGRRRLSAAETQAVFERLLRGAGQGSRDIVRAVIEFLHAHPALRRAPAREAPSTHAEPDRETIWAFLELGAEHLRGHEAREWAEVVLALASEQPARAARLAVRALKRDDLETAGAGEHILATLAPDHPSEVMNAFGRALLDSDGWRLQIGKHSALVSRLPVDVVVEWLRSSGVEAARALARHLPAPYDGPDRSTAPPLVEFVFTQFADDDETFHNFCMGVHDMEVLDGAAASVLRSQADTARRFLRHPLKRIREWAKLEIEERLSAAARFEQIEAERRLA